MRYLTFSNGEASLDSILQNSTGLTDITQLKPIKTYTNGNYYLQLSEEDITERRCLSRIWLTSFSQNYSKIPLLFRDSIIVSYIDRDGYELVYYPDTFPVGVRYAETDELYSHLQEDVVVDAKVTLQNDAEPDGEPQAFPDGSIISGYSCVAFPLFDKNSEFTGALAILALDSDITEEEKLRGYYLAASCQQIYNGFQKFETFIPTMLNGTSEYSLMLDVDDHILNASNSFRSRMGLTDDSEFAYWRTRVNYDLCPFSQERFLNKNIVEFPDRQGTQTALFFADDPRPIDLPDIGTYRIVSLHPRLPVSAPVSSSEGAFSSIAGRSDAIRATIRLAARVAKKPANVLLEGETGTGKELFASAIHRESGRSGEYVSINCGAMPKDLLQSELFGYEDGAFTGAHRGGSIGLFERANKGTVFLDEIEEMPPEMQVSLLRVLETRSFYRIGGRKKIDLDVRIIAASNRSLRKEVEEGRFRRDLYYRLNVFYIQIPPLRDRKEDIEILTQVLLKRLCDSYSIPLPCLEQDAIASLTAYGWPGNVRELRNALESALIVHENDVIQKNDLPQFLFEKESLSSLVQSEMITLQAAEEKAILIALNQHDWNIAKAARSLAISRSTLYRKIEEYNIHI